jgi:hypothetical protein
VKLTEFVATAGIRGPGSTMPTRFSGSAADSSTVSPSRGRFLISRSMATASGCANCSPLNPLTNRPPLIVPRASIRRSAHSTSRQGTARFSRTSRSRNTTPHRTASCSATASASSSGSQSGAARAAATTGPPSASELAAAAQPVPAGRVLRQDRGRTGTGRPGTRPR